MDCPPSQKPNNDKHRSGNNGILEYLRFWTPFPAQKENKKGRRKKKKKGRKEQSNKETKKRRQKERKKQSNKERRERGEREDWMGLAHKAF